MCGNNHKAPVDFMRIHVIIREQIRIAIFRGYDVILEER